MFLNMIYCNPCIAPLKTLDILQVDDIIHKGCEFLKMPFDELRKFDRRRHVVENRQMLIKLVKDNSTLTLQQIGIRFGGRDHTTVIHSCSTVNSLKKAYPEYRAKYVEMQRYIFG